jgi:hypothetical protein
MFVPMTLSRDLCLVVDSDRCTGLLPAKLPVTNQQAAASFLRNDLERVAGGVSSCPRAAPRHWRRVFDQGFWGAESHPSNWRNGFPHPAGVLGRYDPQVDTWAQIFWSLSMATTGYSQAKCDGRVFSHWLGVLVPLRLGILISLSRHAHPTLARHPHPTLARRPPLPPHRHLPLHPHLRRPLRPPVQTPSAPTSDNRFRAIP